MVLFAHWGKTKSVPLIWIIGITFQIVETCCIVQMAGVSSMNVLDILQINYGRPIVIPIALVILLVFESLKIEKLNFFVQWVATYALGIYLMHPIIIAIANRLTHSQFLFMFSKRITVSSGAIAINLFCVSVVMAVSFALVYVLSRSILKRFVC